MTQMVVGTLQGPDTVSTAPVSGKKGACESSTASLAERGIGGRGPPAQALLNAE